MNDMKCPVCNVGYVHESVNHWCCDYEFCPSYDETDTETYDILIRTRKENEDKQAVLNCVVDMLKTLNQRYALIMGKDVIKETVRLLEQNKGGDNE